MTSPALEFHSIVLRNLEPVLYKYHQWRVHDFKGVCEWEGGGARNWKRKQESENKACAQWWQILYWLWTMKGVSALATAHSFPINNHTITNLPAESPQIVCKLAQMLQFLHRPLILFPPLILHRQWFTSVDRRSRTEIQLLVFPFPSIFALLWYKYPYVASLD